jgi:hypothetical protein
MREEDEAGPGPTKDEMQCRAYAREMRSKQDPPLISTKISKQSRRVAVVEEHELQIFPEQLLEYLRHCGEEVPEKVEDVAFYVKPNHVNVPHRVEFGEKGTYVVVSFKREREDIEVY